jgi:hypothetical protein
LLHKSSLLDKPSLSYCQVLWIDRA